MTECERLGCTKRATQWGHLNGKPSKWGPVRLCDGCEPEAEKRWNYRRGGNL